MKKGRKKKNYVGTRVRSASSNAWNSPLWRRTWAFCAQLEYTARHRRRLYVVIIKNENHNFMLWLHRRCRFTIARQNVNLCTLFHLNRRLIWCFFVGVDVDRRKTLRFHVTTVWTFKCDENWTHSDYFINAKNYDRMTDVLNHHTPPAPSICSTNYLFQYQVKVRPLWFCDFVSIEMRRCVACRCCRWTNHLIGSHFFFFVFVSCCSFNLMA